MRHIAIIATREYVLQVISAPKLVLVACSIRRHTSVRFEGQRKSNCNTRFARDIDCVRHMKAYCTRITSRTTSGFAPLASLSNSCWYIWGTSGYIHGVQRHRHVYIFQLWIYRASSARPCRQTRDHNTVMERWSKGGGRETSSQIEANNYCSTDVDG